MRKNAPAPGENPEDEMLPDTAGEEKSIKKRGRVRPASVIMVLLLAVLAVLVFVFRDRLAGENSPQEGDLAAEAFSYETGSAQMFRLVGNGLAVASGSSCQMLSGDGVTVFKQAVSYDAPAVFTSDNSALFCDIGSTGCILVNLDGTRANVEVEGNIISADMNSNGYFTLVTEEAGYKGLVSVYDSGCKLLYKWWSGTSYVLKAVLGPDNRTLAVLCADSRGGALRYFTITSESEQASVSFPGELVFDICFMGGDTVCAISEDRAYFLSPEGDEKGVYEFGENYLTDYEFSDNFAAVCLNAYRRGSGGTVITLDTAGRELGRAYVEKNIGSMSANSRQLLIMTSGDLILYNQEMTLLGSNETLMTAKCALLKEKGEILLASAYSADKFSF